VLGPLSSGNHVPVLFDDIYLLWFIIIWRNGQLEAERYWATLIQNNEAAFRNIDKPKFKDVFSVCGGSIYLTNAFMREWLEEEGR